MELTLAIDILKKAAAAKQAEADAFTLAVSVLEARFAPQLQVLENARTKVAELTNSLTSEQEKTALLTMEKQELAETLNALESVELSAKEVVE
jgi:hypothetical protein